MVDEYGGDFGNYVAVTEIISAAGQAAVIAEVNKLLALIPDNSATAPGSEAHPEFDRIHPALATQLRAEIAALKVAIDAAPTS